PHTVTRECPMTPVTQIERHLRHALLHEGVMPYGLYAYELEELLDELQASLAADHEDSIFAVTEKSGHVAIVLIEKPGDVYIEEQARKKLQALWPTTYTRNRRHLIPVFARQLHHGELPINGVKTVGRV